MNRVAIVDDDVTFSEMLADYLKSHGCAVSTFHDAESIISALNSCYVDIVIIDLNIGAGSGLGFLRRIRTAFDVPCIILTNAQDEVDRIVSLEVGADDSIGKNASHREILARIRAIIRRSGRLAETVMSTPMAKGGGWRFSPEKRELYGPDGIPVNLTTVEFETLLALIEAHGQPISRAELCQRVFRRPYRAGDRTVDMAIVNLRRKIEPNAERPEVIKTVRSLGYVFTGFSSAASTPNSKKMGPSIGLSKRG